MAAPLAGQRDDAVAAELARALLTEDDAFVAVLRPDRSVVAQVTQPARADDLPAALRELGGQGGGAGVRVGGVDAVMEPVRGERVDGPATGWVVVGRDGRRVDAVVTRLTLFGAGTFLAAVALAILLAWLLTGRLMMKPLIAMTAVAERVSGYDLQARAAARLQRRAGRSWPAP